MSVEPRTPLHIRDANRAILYRAYDDGDGNTISLVPSHHGGWFVGTWDGDPVMEGIEVEGTLYSVVPQSGNGTVSVLVGQEIEENVVGPIFDSKAEARAYIQGLTAK